MHINIRTIVNICTLGAIFLCGFYLRYESIKKTEVILPLRADAGNYFMCAFNLRHKHTYSSQVGDPYDKKSIVTPDAIRYPGYPLFLTLLVDDIPSARVINKIIFIQMIISILTIFISFLFLRKFLSIFWSLIASSLVALSPHLIVANSYVLTETLFCFYLSILGWIICFFISKPSFWSAGIVGITLGMLNLVRPSLQYFPLALAFFFLFHYGKKKGIQFAAIMLLCFVITYSPWVIRNTITLEKASDSERMAMFLQHGMYPDFKYNNIPESYGFPYKYDPKSDKFHRNTSTVIKEIARRFHEEPLRHIAWFVFKKPVALWSWDMVQGQGDAFVYPVSESPYMNNHFFQWTSRLMYAVHFPIVLLCLFGTILIWCPSFAQKFDTQSAMCVKFISILLIYYTSIHLIGVPLPRYSVPFRPFLYGMAMFTAHSLITNLRHKDN